MIQAPRFECLSFEPFPLGMDRVGTSDGDVKRAASLYRGLTEDYASHMTVEDLIKAGKG